MVRRLWTAGVAGLLGLLTSPAVADTRFSLTSGRLQLDIDLALDGPGCVLTDRRTGEVWQAPDFGVVRVWDATEDRMRSLIISPQWTASRCTVGIERLDDARAVIHVDTGEGSASAMGTMSFGVAFDVELRLADDALEIAVPIGSLREQQAGGDIPQRWRLMSIEPLPHLGATPAGSPGCLLIPSWSGAVYYFDRAHPRANRASERSDAGDPGSEAWLRRRWGFRADAPAEYGGMMYGQQAAWEDQLQQPVYATLREGGGLMGVLLSGEYDTEIRARRDQGPRRLASVNPVWHYRRFWHSKLDPVDRRLRLIALDRAQADYSGVGNVFREILLKERGVQTLRQRAAGNPDIAYFLDAAYLRVMMGMRQAALDGRGEMRSFQSWDAFAARVPLFREAGFEKIQFVFVGANFGGHDGAHPTVFPLEPAHGGEEGFRRAMRAIEEAGYRATFHLNYKDVYRCSPDWTPEAIQVNEYGELRYHGAWIGGYSYQGIPQEMLERFGRRDLPRLRALGLRGMHYWDACLSVMEETFPPNRVITRREYGEGAIAYFRYAAEVFGAVGCETSIAGLLGIIVNAGNTSCPFGGEPGVFPGNGYSEAGLIDHWVPLQHVIYHGLCCYHGGPDVAGRTGYEFNAAPTREEVAKIRAKWLEHRRWGGELEYEFIIRHERLAPGVTCTTLSDGTSILANAGRSPWAGPEGSLAAGACDIRRPAR